MARMGTSRLRCQERELKVEMARMITKGRDSKNENFNARDGNDKNFKVEMSRMRTQGRDRQYDNSRSR